MPSSMAARGLEPNRLPPTALADVRAKRVTRSPYGKPHGYALHVSWRFSCGSSFGRLSVASTAQSGPQRLSPVHQVPLTVLPSVPHKEDAAKDSLAMKGTLPMHLPIGPLSFIYAA